MKTDIRDSGGNTAAHMACETGALEVVKVLVESRCFHQFAKNIRGESPFYIAVYNNNANIVKYLLDNTHMRWAIEHIKTCLLVGCESGHVTIIQNLLAYETYSLDIKFLLSCLERALKFNRSKVSCIIMETIQKQVESPYVTMRVNEKTILQKVITSLLQRHFWNPLKEVPQCLLALWITILRHIPHLDYQKIEYHLMESIFRSAQFFQTDQIVSHPNVNKVFMLYYAMTYGHEFLLSIIENATELPSKKEFSSKLKSKGISLVNMSVQNPKLLERFKKIYGTGLYDSEEVRSFKE